MGQAVPVAEAAAALPKGCAWGRGDSGLRVPALAGNKRLCSLTAALGRALPPRGSRPAAHRQPATAATDALPATVT